MERLDRTNDSDVEGLIAPTVESMGYAIVRARFSGARAPVLQLMVERADGAAVTVDDCAAVSRAVSAALDAADPIEGPYNLEVSSPGIERPLTRPGDYARFAGHEAKIEIEAPVEGRRRFRGRLIGYADPLVRIDIPGRGAMEVPFAAIRAARLVASPTPPRAGGAERRRGRPSC